MLSEQRPLRAGWLLTVKSDVLCVGSFHYEFQKTRGKYSMNKSFVFVMKVEMGRDEIFGLNCYIYELLLIQLLYTL